MLKKDGVINGKTLSAALIAALMVASAPAMAQTAATPPGAAPAAAPPAAGMPAPGTDPVVATVNGQDIHFSDLTEATRGLPAQARQMPPQVLLPMLVDQLVDRAALIDEAKRTGLDKDPAVKREIDAAADTALQGAYLQKMVGPLISDDALRARYAKDIAGKTGETEIHARHILVPDEAEAKTIIEALKKGGDFAALAKEHSKDGGGANGGDLGWITKDSVVEPFADAAFALKPGEFTETPVHTEFGWHVIKVDESRTAPPPSFEQSKDQLRQEVIREEVQKLVDQARSKVQIARFNLDGTKPSPTDGATPPPAAPSAPAAPASK
jgi:peptidyl-prolyl cis-trans isomerase C